MVSSKYLLRLIRLLAAVGSGTALLGIAILCLGALSATADITGTDPEFRAITITATLPISDTAPGSGISRTVYFNNMKAGGVLTLTLNISGTPTLTLTCGPGFNQTTTRVYTSSDSPLLPVITYSATSEHGDQDLSFTATNANNVTTTLVLTFTRDITAPEVFITDTLFTVLSTANLPTYTISGRVTDMQAGVQAVRVLTGTGGAWQDANLSGNDWWWKWTLPEEDWEFHELRVSATDHVSNTSTVTGTTYVDTIPPINPDSLTSTVPTNTWGTWVGLPVTWTAGHDGSNVISYTYVLTTTWPYSIGFTDPLTTVQAITLPLDSDGVYTFSLRTQDLAGNLATDTIRSGAFLRDATPPYTGSVIINEGAEFVTGTTVALTLFSNDAASGVAQMCLSNTDACTSWEPYAISKTEWSLGDSDGIKTVYAWFRDQALKTAGPYSDTIQVFVPPSRLYLPLVVNNYRPFVNGDFEQGDFGWDFVLDQGLPAQLINSFVEESGGELIPLGDNCVLLGRTDYLCSSTGVPVGYAAVEQTFAVPSTTIPISLTFRYVIYTWDASPSDTYDRFEVYVVTDSSEELELWDGNQNSTSLSCDKRWRVPGPDNPRDSKQSGWATGEVALGPFKGQMITISFRNYNRFDGWYNTYTYLDDIRLVTEP